MRLIGVWPAKDLYEVLEGLGFSLFLQLVPSTPDCVSQNLHKGLPQLRSTASFNDCYYIYIARQYIDLSQRNHIYRARK